MAKKLIRTYEVEEPEDDYLDDSLESLSKSKLGNGKAILPEELPPEVCYEAFIKTPDRGNYRVQYLEEGVDLGRGWAYFSERYDSCVQARAVALQSLVDLGRPTRVIYSGVSTKTSCVFYKKDKKFYVAIPISKTHLLEQEILPGGSEVGRPNVAGLVIVKCD